MARGAAVPATIAASSPIENSGINRRMPIRTWWMIGFCVVRLVTWLFIIPLVRTCVCPVEPSVKLSFYVPERVCSSSTNARFQGQRRRLFGRSEMEDDCQGAQGGG